MRHCLLSEVRVSDIHVFVVSVLPSSGYWLLLHCYIPHYFLIFNVCAEHQLLDSRLIR
jgi:hypothetical protein